MIRILHVDDSECDFEITEKSLRRLEKKIFVTWVESSRKALRALETERYDCILSDFQMPGMDGLELLKILRKKEISLPFIFFTGQGNEELAAAALREGADDYFTKEAGIAHYERLLNSIKRLIKASKRVEEHKRAQEALRESEERYRSFIERSSEGIWRIGIDKPLPIDMPEDELIQELYQTSHIAECNQVMAEMYGYESPEELIGARLVDLHGGTEVEQNLEANRAFIRCGFNIRDAETAEVDKYGDRKFFMNNAVGIIRDGKIHGVWGSQRDITEIRRTETELRQSKKLFEQLFRQNPIGAIYLGLDFQVLDANPFFEKQFGYAREEIIGRQINDLIIPEDKVQEAIELDSKPEEIYMFRETIRKKKDGALIPVLTAGAPVRVDGITIGYIGLYADISERKRAETALKKTENDFKELLQVSRDVIYKIDLNTEEYEYLSPAVSQITGYTNREVFKEGPGFFNNLVHPEDRELVRCHVDEQEPDAIFRNFAPSIEYRLEHRKGGLRWISENRALILDGDGKPLSVVGTVRDVTEKKNADEELHKSRDNLKKRSTELEAAYKDLETFNHYVSHDMQAPLRRIHSYAQILIDDHSDNITEDGKKFLGRILDTSARMMQLVSDLLKLSSLRRAELVRESVNLTALAAEIVEVLRLSEPDRKCEIIIADNVTAEGDAKLLRLVMEHLISNAWKFTQNNDLTRIEFGVEEVGGERVYSVEDNGVGFDMSGADKLFSPFFRMHSYEDFEGTGIGLAIVGRVIELHGGNIRAEAEVNKGAKFSFSLG